MESATNPIFHPTKACKILISPGHGAGWVTYAPRTAPDAFRAWMLTFEPLIGALERKGGGSGDSSPEEALTLFHHQAKLRFNIDRLMLARVQDLFVLEIPASQGAFEIREVDGRETVWDVSRRRDVVVPPPPSTTTTVVAGESVGKSGEEKPVGKGIPVEVAAPLKGMGSTPAASAGSVVSLGLSSASAAGMGSGSGVSGGRVVK
ncbi:hypothetical protein KC332_g7373 [Hortaea werneckii]|uniref:Uncharacterized protein n=2 Tax=Hortaea werneckii TaxID=91943 RepID=A0A3M7I7K5_HORWE|nr:hypothetical protein KC358_g7017 [Hortaea werneckii]OTA32674.1 hypothetical protein BTJ68_07758 [Hortaea werneckii EXF-2000]KAI6835511.1 hypothetical protein KC350_g6486 [Hortaea werneckii]KAI6930986.1 hypothetical protein KC348_g7407 [Hortaea werneckii]KAI6935590.1 hypothetical protein KC341_g6820 [Hortaea werneckii]